MIQSYKLSLGDFLKISRENEYWLWHIVGKKYEEFSDIQPLSGPPAITTKFHTFREIMEKVPVPVFETGIDEAIDYLMYLDNTILQKIKKKHFDGPVILGYNYSRFVYSTLHFCYCDEGVLEVISKLNPNLLSGLVDF